MYIYERTIVYNILIVYDRGIDISTRSSYTSHCAMIFSVANFCWLSATEIHLKLCLVYEPTKLYAGKLKRVSNIDEQMCVTTKYPDRRKLGCARRLTISELLNNFIFDVPVFTILSRKTTGITNCKVCTENAHQSVQRASNFRWMIGFGPLPTR